MLHIVTDTSAMFLPEEAEHLNLVVVPLQIIHEGQSYSDYEDITTSKIVEDLKNKKIYTTSLPQPARKLDIYNELLSNPEDEVLDLTIANGLSGTYNSAKMLKEMCDAPDRVSIWNTASLAGSHRLYVEKALQLREKRYSKEEIIKELDLLKEKEISCLMVKDFGCLARSGRISSLKGVAADFLRLTAIAVKTPSGEALDIYGTARTTVKAFDKLREIMEKHHPVSVHSRLILCHGEDEALAQKAKKYFEEKWPQVKVETYCLCPLFIVHGGPSCLSAHFIG